MPFVLLPTAYLRQKYYYYGYIIIMLKRRKCACAGLSALPILFAAMTVVDGIEATGYFNIITNHLNIITTYLYVSVNMSFDAWFQWL